MRLSLLLVPLVVLPLAAVAPLRAQPLGDPGFEALAGKEAPRTATPGGWSVPPGAPYADGVVVKGDPGAPHGGAAATRLQVTSWGRLAALRQTLELPAGVYELRVWAKGQGVLTLTAGSERRRGDLTADWAPYSLAFAQPAAGPCALTVLANELATVDDAALTPLSGERLAAWQRQEAARAEYGFVPPALSAQTAQPGAPLAGGEFEAGPVTWREKVVYYDPRYDTCWSFHPEVLADYLGAHGFRKLGAVALGEWMRQAVADGAAGTVCVLTHGIAPSSVFGEDPPTSMARRYLEAGGRLVWVGDVPFYYSQDETHPQVYSRGAFTTTTGVRGGWDVGCWGNQGAPALTALGKAWGTSHAGGTAIAAYPEDVTAALSSFHSDYADSDLAVAWLKSFSPRYPWSGFLFAHRADDFARPEAQESVYRLALYCGKAVEAPKGIDPQAGAEPILRVLLDAPRDRRNFYRGETVPVRLEATGRTPAAGKLRVELQRNGERIPGGETAWPTKAQPTTLSLPTADLACGEYRLRVVDTGATGQAPVWEAPVSLCARGEDPAFFFAVSGARAGNPYRQELLMKDLVAHGFQIGSATVEISPAVLDLALKYGLRFGMRAHGSATGLTDAEREEAFRRGPNGETIPGAWEGGRPVLGIVSPRQRELVSQDMAKQVKELAAWPNAFLRCHTNDDFSMYYGYDWSELAKRLFKEKTGLEAPVPPELAKLGRDFRNMGGIARPKGVVPENDPWLQWNIFCTLDIGGGYNKALSEACAAAVPGMKVGPVPGGMQLPLCAQGQYPPHQFGPNGFSLVQYYYYLNYWQPSVGNLYWDEIGRMGNRNLDVWCMPDCGYQTAPAYFRNTLFLHLAGGVQGLDYYTYTEANAAGWGELGRLSNAFLQRLGPCLGKLRPARTQAALLLPYTQWTCTWLYPTTAVYPYANLLGAHLDVQPTCEEEAISGYIRDYQTILLWRVEWMREAAVRALEDYIAQGGVVIADALTTVPIKGALRTSVDLAMGEGKSDPDPNDPRFGGPGIQDYLHPDRVQAIRTALQDKVPVWADCDDPTVILRRHEYGGVSYLWVVNSLSQEEYEYLRPRVAAGARPEDPAKAREEADAYLAERADGKRFSARVTLPAGNWAAYDLLAGKALKLEKVGARLALTAEMERLGGTLIALYPEPVSKVALSLARTATRGQAVPLTVTVLGKSGKPLAGTQPLAVEARTPAGVWAELTGAHATSAGKWTATFYPARNDPAGKWTVRARELSSGLAGETSVTVK